MLAFIPMAAGTLLGVLLLGYAAWRFQRADERIGALTRLKCESPDTWPGLFIRRRAPVEALSSDLPYAVKPLVCDSPRS